MSALVKTTLWMFRENVGRFIANTLIIFFSLVIIAGLGGISPVTLTSFSDFLKEENASDLIVKSTSLTGFSDSQIETIESVDGVSGVDGYFAMDLEIDGEMTRIYAMELEGRQINTLELVEGRWPTGYLEIAVGEGNSVRESLSPGDTVSFDLLSLLGIKMNLTVTGVVSSPLYFCYDGEPSQTDPDTELGRIIYLSPSLVSALSSILPVTDVAVTIDTEYDFFSDEYTEQAAEVAAAITSALGADSCAVLTMEENFSYASLDAAMDKVEILALVFPFAFIAICALVNFVTLRRLIEDERTRLGCCASLGVQPWKLMCKYLSFSLASSILGFALGLFVGPFLLPYVAYVAIGTMFTIPEINFSFAATYGLIFGSVIIVISALETAIMVWRRLLEKPSELLLGKAPKPGKRIFLERIKPLWKILPFRYKSSLRNIFRKKVNLVLTTLSVAGSEALVFIGFALLSVSIALKNDVLYSSLAGPMVPISFVIIVCAVALSVLIVFNLCDMNIAERNRELATLKVLGYQDVECDLYVFRETIIMSVFGMILGIPMGVLVMWWALTALDFGTLADIRWYWYILTVAVIAISSAIVDGLLSRKIRAIDMNESLKSLD